MPIATVLFDLERETKNTVRYAETPAPGHEPVVGTLYLQKRVLPTPYPERVKVTIEEA